MYWNNSFLSNHGNNIFNQIGGLIMKQFKAIVLYERTKLIAECSVCWTESASRLINETIQKILTKLGYSVQEEINFPYNTRTIAVHTDKEVLLIEKMKEGLRVFKATEEVEVIELIK